MNGRMLELAIAAGLKKDHGSDAEYIGDFDWRLFGELIVKDCKDLCSEIRNDALVQKKSEYLTAAGKMIYEGVYGGATNCGFAIQNRFGEEE